MRRSTSLLPLVCGLVLLGRCVFAQAPSFEGQRVTAVEYNPAQQPLEVRELADIQPVKAGEPFRAENVAAAIDRLYATGRYADIRVEAEPASGGVLVRFVTTDRWFVGGVDAEGKISSPPNRGQLISVTNLNLGLPYAEADLKTAEDNIMRMFQRNGLYEASVAPEFYRDPDGNQIHLTFRVKAGKRARYDRPVISGDTKLSDDTIVSATGWRYRIIHIWKHVNAQRTRGGIQGIQKKYQSKDRLMARVRVRKLDYDAARRRVRPVLEINAGPKVSVTTLEAKMSKRTLRKYVPIYDERRVDEDLIVEGARNLRDYFQTKGYYDVDIDFRDRQAGPDERVIEYVVARGERYKLVKVELQGNKYFGEDTLRERMFLEPAGLIRFRHGRYSEAMRKKDEQNIENLYRSNGFRDAKATSTVTRDYNGKTGDMAVTFTVNEGAQWFVDNITLNGVTQLDREDLLSRLNSLQGQPYSDFNVAADRTVILTDYYTKGFPDAAFTWRSEPSTRPNHVNLTYDITEGRRQYVRDVLVTGIRTTRWSLVDRNINVNPGDPLSPTAMLDAQRTLYNLGIFARVNAAIQNPDGQEERKYVLYDIDEAARYRLNLGFGAELARFGPTPSTLTLASSSGNTGLGGRVSADLSRMNFLGLGHVVSLRGRWSNLEKQASFNYLAPRFRNVEGRNITFTLLYDNTYNVQTFASVRQEASIQISQQFTKATNAIFRMTYRRVSTSNVVIPSLLIPSLLQPVRIGMPSVNVVQDKRDDPADPHRGIFNTLDVGVAARAFGSQRSFMRTLARNATYHRVTRNVIFARQTQLGLIFPFATPAGVAENEAVPLPERFFGGGSTSHRGFPENQAGPRDVGSVSGDVNSQATGFPLGGNALLFNNLELRFPLIGDNIRGVLFHDMGNIYSRIGKISFRQSQRNLQDFDYMVHAVGFGVRYKTPVGPVRVDLAYSVNPPSYLGFNGTLQELLQCNPNLPPSQLPGSCQSTPQNVSHFQFFFSIGQTF